MSDLPPGIAIVGICEPLPDGGWLVTGWSFDFKDKPPTFINIDEGTICGFSYEQLHEISHRHRKRDIGVCLDGSGPMEISNLRIDHIKP